jgi:hypothetical protein
MKSSAVDDLSTSGLTSIHQVSRETVLAHAGTHLDRAMNMRSVDNRMLAGIEVPVTPVVDRAIEFSRQKCESYLFNHVVRSWLFAARMAQLQRIEHDAEVVAVGTFFMTSRSMKASPDRAVSR